MAIQLQLRRGNTVQHTTFTGAIGEVTFDTSNNTIRAHDGNTAGGFELATKADLANVAVGNVTLSANLAANTTDDLPQGSNNLYFSNALAIGALTGGDNITIEANGMVISTASAGNVDLSGYVLANALANVATTGEYSDLANAPSLANVALTGEYSDLANTPAFTSIYNGTTSINIPLANGAIVFNVNNTTDVADVNEWGVNVNSNVLVTGDMFVNGTLQADNLNISTSNVSEGTNLYFTNTRAIGALTAGENITIESNGLVVASTTSNVDANVAWDALSDDIVPAADSTLNIGNTTNRFASVYADAVALGNIFLKENNGALIYTNNLASNTNIFDTDDVPEGNNNLYYTDSRVNDYLGTVGTGTFVDDGTYATANAVAALSTSNIAEGSNLYFTNARAVGALTAGNNIAIEANGLVVGTATGGGAVDSVNGETGNVVLTTANVAEDSNLYFTNARAVAALTAGENIVIESNGLLVASFTIASGSITADKIAAGAITADKIAAGAITVDKLSNTITTANIAEGSNLYFTNARAIAAFTAGDGIDISANGQIVSTATGGTTYGDSNVETYLGAVDVDIVPSGNAKNLGESSNTWNNIYANNLIIDGQLSSQATGIPTIQSDTSIRLTANDSVVLTSSPLQLASFSYGELTNITAANGMLVFNTTNVKVQAYVNGNWVDLH